MHIGIPREITYKKHKHVNRGDKYNTEKYLNHQKKAVKKHSRNK